MLLLVLLLLLLLSFAAVPAVADDTAVAASLDVAGAGAAAALVTIFILTREFDFADFPADQSSLFFRPRPPDEVSKFTWRRPHELVDDPSIYVDGTSRKDVIQVCIFEKNQFW